ncbi:PTS sugar transporter subunit IIA [Jannaschia seohaensis]|uniref:PTS system mannose-specific IIA component n=1 Tax=Jannaschia seohaensis TaxID=475081 RepID=A0A2Y9ADP8_9RHOB|nr:PTS fructose transporter subunit IIA [Jannaschia seohaensis]PWJ20968.1 PTS system mannose-specific IIA component [Jannaschia seohaensis]SSA41378.1 PTS system, mannose-specific IIA component [Jannaschia seohaensis]
MIGIVIVAHGGLADEYLKAVEHVIGPQHGVRAITVSAACDRASKQAEIRAAADAVDEGQGVVIVTDIFGGSPSNLSMAACQPEDRVIFYGANLPALIKLARSRAKPVSEAVALAKAAGMRYMDVAQGPAA